MKITDELRKYVSDNSYPYYNGCAGGVSISELTDIADRIDAEHERKRLDYEREFREWKHTRDTCYVELPKDAYGEVIHIGDVMEGVDKYDTLKKVEGKVITVSFESDGIVDVAVRAWDSDGKSWRRAYLDSGASVYRHHKPPTVEDLLVDMHRKLSEVSEAYAVDSDELEDKFTHIISEYAAKLQLSEEA